MLVKNNKLKIAYIHGRPQSHPMQMKCAEAIEADFFPVDFRIRWHDRTRANKFLKYFSWLVCAFTFPNVQTYNVFLAGGLHITLPLMRIFKRIRDDQKIIVHLGDHTLYFLYSNRYKVRVHKLLLWTLSKYDAIIVEGKMGARFAKKMLGEKTPPIYIVSSGIPKNHFDKAIMVTPKFSSHKILFMGQGPNKNRMFYKGLDITIEVFKKLHKENNFLELIIVGEWEDNLISELLDSCEKDTRKNIHFIGQVNDLSPYLEDSFLYLHCARGEAFGVTVLIAMLSGMIPIVSNLTGSQEVVEELCSELVVPLEIDIIVKKIQWVLSLNLKEKEKLSIRAKEIALKYSEENVVNQYKETFFKVVKDL